MAFQIIEIVDAGTESALTIVSHEGHQVHARIRASQEDGLVVRKTFQAEIDYDEVLEWHLIDDFSDDKSGIWQAEDGIHLAGRIHNVLDYGDGKTIMDIYAERT